MFSQVYFATLEKKRDDRRPFKIFKMVAKFYNWGTNCSFSGTSVYSATI